MQGLATQFQDSVTVTETAVDNGAELGHVQKSVREAHTNMTKGFWTGLQRSSSENLTAALGTRIHAESAW